MICCKVTAPSILITADKRKEKTGKTFRTNKEDRRGKKSSRLTVQSPQQESSLACQLQDKNVSTVQSPCTQRYTRPLFRALLQYLGISTGQHSSAILHREVSLRGASTYRHTCPRPHCDIIDSPLKTVGECPEGGGVRLVCNGDRDVFKSLCDCGHVTSRRNVTVSKCARDK